jgi:hypothetical protein
MLAGAQRARPVFDILAVRIILDVGECSDAEASAFSQSGDGVMIISSAAGPDQ